MPRPRGRGGGGLGRSVSSAWQGGDVSEGGDVVGMRGAGQARKRHYGERGTSKIIAAAAGSRSQEEDMHPMAPHIYALSPWAALAVSTWPSDPAKTVKAWGLMGQQQAGQLPAGVPPASAFRSASSTERFHRLGFAKGETIGLDLSSYGLVCFAREVGGRDYTADGAAVCVRWRAVELED